MRLFLLLFALFSLRLQAQDEPHRRANYRDAGLLLSEPVDSIVVYKRKREMKVYHQGRPLKTYVISLGIEPDGPKRFEGDLRTPEGLYYINDRNRRSSYHKNLAVSYPSLFDSLYARMLGQSPGGEIKLHGFPNKHRKDQEIELLNSDWTLGCIALSDAEIDELYEWVSMYCPILILP